VHRSLAAQKSSGVHASVNGGHRLADQLVGAVSASHSANRCSPAAVRA
jgi:hypothetical protein